MKFIVFVAPSKTFTPTQTKGTTTPLFSDKTAQLHSQLIKMSKTDIIKNMKISSRLADDVYDYFHHPQSGAALRLYRGVSFKAMDSQTFHPDANRLYIIDAYYGLVRPFDHITCYRLDFTMNFLGNLYDYWRESINEYLSSHHQNDVLIDLCSHEFSSLIPRSLTVIRIDFALKDKKISNVLLKQMRGKMTRYLLENCIDNIDQIKQIKIEDFYFSPQSSSHHHFVFMR